MVVVFGVDLGVASGVVLGAIMSVFRKPTSKFMWVTLL